MAFFKFRFPGQSASAEAVTSGPNENIEVVRRRARHRLMGAVVLVLVAVVGFPLLFDTQPRPVAVDTPIVIPDRQSVSPLNNAQPVPATQAPAQPLLPEAGKVSAQSSLDSHEEMVLPTAPTAQAVPAKPATREADVKTEPQPEAKLTTAAKSEKPEPVAKLKDDGDKAKALLEGKTAPAAMKTTIQVGAFSDAVKVREIRQKLEQAGLKTYTQVVTKDGKNSTRIRVGPYETREEADKVAARIRKLNLPATVLTL